MDYGGLLELCTLESWCQYFTPIYFLEYKSPPSILKPRTPPLPITSAIFSKNSRTAEGKSRQKLAITEVIFGKKYSIRLLENCGLKFNKIKPCLRSVSHHNCCTKLNLSGSKS